MAKTLEEIIEFLGGTDSCIPVAQMLIREEAYGHEMTAVKDRADGVSQDQVDYFHNKAARLRQIANELNELDHAV